MYLKYLPKTALLVVAFVWGSSFAFQQHLVEAVNPIVFTFYNFLGTFLLFFIYSLYKKENLLYRWKEGLILGLLLTGMEIAQMYGLRLSTAANTSFISNIGMLLIPLWGLLLYKHAVKKIDIVSLCIVALGVYFLVGGVEGFSLGDAFLILSACFMGFYFLLSERFQGERRGRMSTLCTQQFLVISLLTAILISVLSLTFTVDNKMHFDLFWQTIVFNIFPYTLIQWASKYSNEMAIAMYDGVVEPLVGGLVAWVLFNEIATSGNVFGAFIMVFAFALSLLFKTKKNFGYRRQK